MSVLEPGMYRWSFGGKSYDGILDSDGDFSYLSSDGRHCTRIHCKIGDARPLIVLDIAHHDAAVRILRSMADREDSEDSHPGRGLRSSIMMRTIADQIEAQVKPARIPEPDYAGARVTARVGHSEPNEFLRIVTLNKYQWASLRTGSVYNWDALTDPTFICAGVQQ